MTNIKKSSNGRFWVPEGPLIPETSVFPTMGNHQRVVKISGDYRFPGILVGMVRTPNNKERLLVMSTSEDTFGMLHIFAPEQMEVDE